ncbi:hypothetical protein QJQ45_027805 [Haematococcus lacustris]|nr:hypothetical protein QJQ45_027805 [Haematococcus lacustris]
MGMGLDPGAIQAVSAASGVWREDGCLQGFYRSKLTRSQVQHDSGLIQARLNTQQWNGNIKLKLQHLAAATPVLAAAPGSSHPLAQAPPYCSGLGNSLAVMTPTAFERHSGMQTTKKWKCSIKVDMGRHGAMSLGCWLAAQKKQEASTPTPSSWGRYSQTPATRHDAPSHGWSGVRSLNRRQVTPPGHTPHFSHVLVEAHAAVGIGHSQQRFEHTEPGWTSGSEDVDLATLRQPLARPGQQGQGPESCHPPARQLSGLPQLWPKPPSPPALPEDLPCIQVPPPWAVQHPLQGEEGSSQDPPLPVPPASPMLPWARARAVFGSAGRQGGLGWRGSQGGQQGGQGWEHATAQHGPYVDVPEQGVEEEEEEGGEWAGEEGEGDEEEGVGWGEQQCSGGMLQLEAGEQVLGAMVVVAEKAGEGEGEGGASVEEIPLMSQVSDLPLHAEHDPLPTAPQSHLQPHGSPHPPYPPPPKASSAGTAAAAPPSHPTLCPAITPNYKEQLLAALRPKRRRSSSSSRALAPVGPGPPASPPPRGGGEAGQGGDLSGSDTTSLVESPSQGRGAEADMEVEVECGWVGTGGGRGVGGEETGQQEAAAYPAPLPAVSSRQEGGDPSQEGLPTPHAPAGPPCGPPPGVSNSSGHPSSLPPGVLHPPALESDTQPGGCKRSRGSLSEAGCDGDRGRQLRAWVAAAAAAAGPDHQGSPHRPPASCKSPLAANSHPLPARLPPAQRPPPLAQHAFLPSPVRASRQGAGSRGPAPTPSCPRAPAAHLPWHGQARTSPGVMAPWMSLLGVTPGLGALGVSPAQLASVLQQQGYTLDHVLCWGEHVRVQLDLLTATAAVMGGQRAGQLAWGLEDLGRELDLGQNLLQRDLMHTDLIYMELIQVDVIQVAMEGEAVEQSMLKQMQLQRSYTSGAGCAISKHGFPTALLLLGGQLLAAVSAGESVAANATLFAPKLLRNARRPAPEQVFITDQADQPLQPVGRGAHQGQVISAALQSAGPLRNGAGPVAALAALVARTSPCPATALVAMASEAVASARAAAAMNAAGTCCRAGSWAGLV